MKMFCCGLVYSTKDPETYWCIETYKFKKPLNSIIDGKKIVKEILYTLLCKKNGCTKIELHSYASDGNIIKIIQKKEISGKGAISFLNKHNDLLVKQPQVCPIKAFVPSKKKFLGYTEKQ